MSPLSSYTESVGLRTERDQRFLPGHQHQRETRDTEDTTEDTRCDITCARFYALLIDRQAAARDPEGAVANLAGLGRNDFAEAIARANSWAVPGAPPPDQRQRALDSLRREPAHKHLVRALVALWALLAQYVASDAERTGESVVAVEDSLAAAVGGPAGRQRSARAAPAASAVCRVATTPRASTSEGEHADAHRPPLMLAA